VSPRRQASSEECVGRRCGSHDTDRHRLGQERHAPASALASEMEFEAESESESASAVVDSKSSVVEVVDHKSAVVVVDHKSAAVVVDHGDAWGRSQRHQATSSGPRDAMGWAEAVKQFGAPSLFERYLI